MTEPQKLAVYYVVNCTTVYTSFRDAQAQSPGELTEHIARSKQLHEDGTLLMAGAFLDTSNEPLRTMAVLTSRDAAEAYIQGDPFVINGKVIQWDIREWSNMFG